MASWLPETLFEIVGQGPAPSKDYYQMLITQSQASENRGLPSRLTTCPSRWSPERRPRWAESGWGPPEAPGPGSQPADFPRHLGLVSRPLPNPKPARPRRACFASPPRRPLPSCGRRFLPVEFSPREEKNRRPGLARRRTSAWEGGKERLIQVSRGGAGRGGGRARSRSPGRT